MTRARRSTFISGLLDDLRTAEGFLGAGDPERSWHYAFSVAWLLRVSLGLNGNVRADRGVCVSQARDYLRRARAALNRRHLRRAERARYGRTGPE